MERRKILEYLGYIPDIIMATGDIVAPTAKRGKYVRTAEQLGPRANPPGTAARPGRV
jgi:hypothetical protein